ncbi:nuclear protein MDM1, partial [Caerostris extrusa]
TKRIDLYLFCLNSNTKRNYVWHPQYKPLAQDVISTAPQSVIKEIGLQRRKQYPELAYRNNEVIRHDLGQHFKEADSRARSEERDVNLLSKSGPRSRSAEPGMSRHLQKSIMVQSFPPITSGRISNLPKTEEFLNISEHPSETSEYKAQFAWPRKTEEEIPCMARKSISMNVIKSSEDAVDSLPKSKLAPVHRPCVRQKELTGSDKLADAKKKIKTEYKAKYKPFTSYVYVEGEWKKTSRLMKVPEKVIEDHVEPWFVEVTERLQKANEYRWRGLGHPLRSEEFSENFKQPCDLTPRPKRVPADLSLNKPKCHQITSKKGETKKKDIRSEIVGEKNSEKEPKKQMLRRPKSAEPAKAKETVKYKRPATTPPAKSTSHSLPSKKRMPKVEEIEKISKTKTGKKQKDENAKQLSTSKKAQQSPSFSNGGKVWLQAGQPVSAVAEENNFPVKEHSDAVRPSSLTPISSASISKQEPSNNSTKTEAVISDEQALSETKSAVPQSSVVPLTHVRTPEEVTGVKSPDPENWIVPIENSEHLEWSGVNTSDTPLKVKSPENVNEKLSEADISDESGAFTRAPSNPSVLSPLRQGFTTFTRVFFSIKQMK